MATTARPKPRGPGGRPRRWEPTPLGSRIESLAARRGLSIQELAQKAGVSSASIYDVMRGRVASPSVAIAFAISDALGVKVDRLFRPDIASADHKNAAR